MKPLPQHLEDIASKLRDIDRDIRYMALSDLHKLLEEQASKNVQIQTDMLGSIPDMLLKYLSEQGGEVQGVALKCVSFLAVTSKPDMVDTLLTQLCKQLRQPRREGVHDLAAIALQRVIAQIDDSAGIAEGTAMFVTKKVLECVQEQPSLQVVQESLEVLLAVLSKFGALVPTVHADVQKALLPELQAAKPGQRKWAILCIGQLCKVCNDSLFDKTVQQELSHLQQFIQNGGLPDKVRTHIQALSSICRSSGYRYSRHVEGTVRVLTEVCKQDMEEEDCREQALACLDVLTCRCGKSEVTPQLGSIATTAITYLSHDPNYDMSMNDESEEEDDEEYEDFEDYDDDDDTSWKTRKAACRLLSSVISMHPTFAAAQFSYLSSALVGRFREREESVRSDIFSTYATLLGAAEKLHGDLLEQLQVSVSQDSSQLLEAIARQIADKSQKTRAGALSVLTQLCSFIPASIPPSLPVAIPAIISSLNDTSADTQLKIGAVLYLETALQGLGVPALIAEQTQTDSPMPGQQSAGLQSKLQMLQPFLDKLLPVLIATSQDRYSKLASDVLKVLASVAYVIGQAPQECGAGQWAGKLLSSGFQRIKVQSVDQEVKDVAVGCIGHVWVALEEFQQESMLVEICAHLIDKLHSESSRLPVLRVLTTLFRVLNNVQPLLACSPTMPPPREGTLEGQSGKGALLSHLCGMLRKQDRVLRQAALETILAFIRHPQVQPPPGDVQHVLQVIQSQSHLLSDEDLTVTLACTNLLEGCLATNPQCGVALADMLLSSIIKLLASPLLQGPSLEAVKQLLVTLAGSGAPNASFLKLRELLMGLPQREGVNIDASGLQLGRSTPVHIALCLAALCAAAGPADTQDTVQKLVANIGQQNLLDSSKAPQAKLALFSLGEIGRHMDLSAYQPHLTVSTLLADPKLPEDARLAAAYSLGGISSGNVGQYTSYLLECLQGQGGDNLAKYLYLQALSQVLTLLLSTPEKQAQLSLEQQSNLLSILFQLALQKGQEEARTVVAECMGKLALLNPQTVITALTDRLASKSSDYVLREAVVQSMRHVAMEGHRAEVQAQLEVSLGVVLKHVCDESHPVRKAAVQLLTAATVCQTKMVQDVLQDLTFVPHVFQLLKVEPSLVREVNLGPFNHKVDDGLDLRKAAYECVFTLLRTFPTHLDLEALFTALVPSGLEDTQDIKYVTCQILGSMANMEAGGQLLVDMWNKLHKPLEMLIAKERVKDDAVKQEVQRVEELVTSGIRVVVLLARQPQAQSVESLQRLVTLIHSANNTPGNPHATTHRQKLEKVESEIGKVYY